MTKIKVVTHSGGFHADDVFGVAALSLLLGKENIEVVRTRDPEIIAIGDYVLDMGGIDDPSAHRFDHHQAGGAGVRTNKIPYAAFGLIWKKFGKDLCGAQEVADDVDLRVVQPIDAHDNGVDIASPLFPDVSSYTLSVALFAFKTGADTEGKMYDAFLEAVTWAALLLEKEIIFSKERMRVFEYAREVYLATTDKSILVFDTEERASRELLMEACEVFPEVYYFIRSHETGIWQVVCAVDDVRVYKNRKSLPESWAGKRDAELAEVSGVSDSVFCHNKRFMAVAKTKEGALALAQLALQT
ncbi:MAG: MYG1 family protein [Patescibacteria group bacterium]